MKFILNILLVSVLVNIPSNTKATPKIQWMTINYPPAYILYGPKRNTGVNDIAMKIMINNMDSYTHEIISNVTMPRMLNFFKSKDIFCSPGLAVTKNQFKETIKSKPILIMPPAGIVILKSRMDIFKIENDRIDLEDLIKNTELNAGIMKGGQYGSYVDNLIEKYKTQHNIYQKTPIDQFLFLYMLLRGRIDYLIDYPISFYSNLKMLKVSDQCKFAFIQVRNIEDIKMVRALCNNNPKSRDVIDTINGILSREYFKKPVTERLLSYLPPEIREKYRKINMEGIGKELY